MTRIDFYILAEQSSGNRYSLACRLAEKIWQQGRRIYLHTNSAEESDHLDRLLWSFREGSFLPHGRIDKADHALNPILIGHGSSACEEHDVMINLATEIPEFFSRFERIAELIDHQPEIRQAGRERFRFYRDRGYPMNTHDIRQ